MTDRQRSDYKVMAELAKYTKMFPDQRYEGQERLNEQIQSNLKENKLPIKINQANSIDAMVFQNPSIMISKKINPQNGDFKRDFRAPIRDAARFKKWLLVYHADNYNDSVLFVDNMMSCGGSYGIQVSEPEYTEVDGKKIQNWADYTVEDFHKFKGFEMIVILLPSRG